MRYLLFSVATFLVILTASAQKVLFVNDNDLTAANTDAILLALDNGNYSDYSYWNLTDSTSELTSEKMSSFDVVIWYTSTDGLELNLWKGNKAGNTEIVDYINSGKRFWLIGLDALYEIYGPTFAFFESGDFGYDQLGLVSYDAQSYQDDGSLGVEKMVRNESANTSFPATLKWIYPTLWYADVCTPQPKTKVIYEMGGNSAYPLLGKASMLHFRTKDLNVLSTFFDPALMDNDANRVSFINASIAFLWANEYTASAPELNEVVEKQVVVQPNPFVNEIIVKVPMSTEGIISYQVYNLQGQEMLSSTLQSISNSITIQLPDLESGAYFIKLKIGELTVAKKLLKKEML